MSSNWFESVAVARERARKRLPGSVYKAIVAGAEAGISMEDNKNAFDEIGLRPLTAGQTAEHRLARTIMGVEAAMPVMISPTGVQAVHPDGEVAVARAAAARGIPMGLASFGSKPISEVIEANPNLFYQMYWAGDRDTMSELMRRARAAGAKGLIITLDWSFVHSRDWGSPSIPEKIDIRTMIDHAPEALTHPRWLLDWIRAGRLPDLGVPNFATGDGQIPRFFDAYGAWMMTPPPTWDDIAGLIAEWDGTCMVKGIMRPDEAIRAAEAGATAISVSNHGGNNIDSSPAAIRVLPGVVEAVGDRVEVYMDGGVRRGSDVVKAVSLGARAVLIGRAYLWGLAAGGQAGVENVLDILSGGISSTLRALGKGSIDELSPEDVLGPTGFLPGGA